MHAGNGVDGRCKRARDGGFAVGGIGEGDEASKDARSKEFEEDDTDDGGTKGYGATAQVFEFVLVVEFGKGHVEVSKLKAFCGRLLGEEG